MTTAQIVRGLVARHGVRGLARLLGVQPSTVVSYRDHAMLPEPDMAERVALIDRPGHDPSWLRAVVDEERKQRAVRRRGWAA